LAAAKATAARTLDKLLLLLRWVQMTIQRFYVIPDAVLAIPHYGLA